MEENELRGVYFVLACFVCSVLFIVMLVFFVQNPTYFKPACLILLALVGVVALDFVLRRVTRVTYRDIGQFGTTAQNVIGRVKDFAPLAIDSPRTTTVKEVFKVPTVTELLKGGILGPNTLLLGFTKEGKAHYGSWDDIRTFAIAGKGRSGKTMTMFFLILQALLNDCIVWVADPHTKTSSITNMLKPLSHLVRFAKTDAEIADMTAAFIDVMELRITGESTDHTPMLLVTDEFTRMIEANSQVYQAVVSCAQQYAGVNGYAMIAGHEWTGREIVKLRRALHAVFVHRLDEGYAKYLIDSKHSKLTEKLRTGSNFFKDTDGDIHQLMTPFGSVNDAMTVLARLQQIEGPYEQNQLVQPVRTEPFYQEEPNRSTETLRLISPKEPNRSDHTEEVMRLRLAGKNQSEIIQEIWKCKRGESQAYQNALAEYKQILQEVKQNVPMET